MRFRRLSLWLWAICLLVACGPAPTLMTYHRQTLDEMAEGTMECSLDRLQFEDSTPDDFAIMANDPETRRYTVRGCDRTAATSSSSMCTKSRSSTRGCRAFRCAGTPDNE